jgi:hypothetical protein
MDEEGMRTKERESDTWPVALTLIVTIICATAVLLAIILS